MNIEDQNSMMKEFESLKKDVQRLKKEMLEHGHSGRDGSEMIRNRIELASGEYIKIGTYSIAEGLATDLITGGGGAGLDIMYGLQVVGRDIDSSDGSKNVILTIEHQALTDGSTNQTFYHASRNPNYTGTKGSISGTIFTTDEYKFTENELVGANLLLFTPGTPSTFYSYKIVSNTQTSITIAESSALTADGVTWQIQVNVYFGAAQYPWRRLYTEEGTIGGVRFGGGNTAGGQNGMLYMDSTGDLYWRNKAGSSTKLN